MKTAAPFYRRILSDAWRIAWGHKHLWVFGFFATMAGFGGVTEPVFNSSGSLYSLVPTAGSAASPAEAIPWLRSLSVILGASNFPATAFVTLLAAALVLGIVWLWIVYGSIGALVDSIRKIERGGDAEFVDEVSVGARAFPSVFGANLMAFLFIFAATVLTAGSLDRLTRIGGALETLLYIGAFGIFTAVAVGFSIVAIFATCEVVAKQRSAGHAFHVATQLVADHWLRAIEMALVVLVATLGIGIMAVLACAVVAIPFLFALFLAAAAKSYGTYVIISTVGHALLIGAVAVVGSLITVFQTAAWTLLWSDLSGGKGAHPKTIRLAKKHTPWLA